MKITIACDNTFTDCNVIKNAISMLLMDNTEPVTLISGFNSNTDTLIKKTAQNASYGVLRVSNKNSKLLNSAMIAQSDALLMFADCRKSMTDEMSHLFQAARTSNVRTCLLPYVIPKMENRLVQFAFSEESDDLLYYQIFIILQVPEGSISTNDFQKEIEEILLDEYENECNASYEEIVENTMARYNPSLSWQAFAGSVENAQLTNAFFV